MSLGASKSLPLRAQGRPRSGDRQVASPAGSSAQTAAAAFSDETLVEALVAHGHRQHAQVLLERYREKVFHIVLSVLGPQQSEEAQDLAQEVCIRMLKKLRQFRRESRFSTWVYRMAFNASLDFERKRKRRTAHLNTLFRQPPEASPSPSEQVGEVQSQHQLRRAVLGLPQTQRIAVQMHYWLDLPVAEIAELLGASTNTIKSHLRRARIRLGQQLKGSDHA